MGLFTTSGLTISITTTTTDPATFNAVGYAALSYTEISGLENAGGFGDESNEVTADDIGLGRTIKLKGQRNAGNMDLVFLLNDADAGQTLLRAAEADDSTGNFHFKVTLPNKLASPGADAIRYFSAKVMTAKENFDTADTVAKLNATIGINTAIVSVAATAS